MDPLLEILPTNDVFGTVVENYDSNPDSLIILSQQSLCTEQIYKNGFQKRVHVVVKNHPFLIQVGMSCLLTWEERKIDFNLYPLEASLVYDTDSLKEVNFVKMKPLEFKCHVSENGDQVTMELRPKVLTSQLEDMLFRVKLYCIDPVTGKSLRGIYIFSEPIKVVSKPEQIKKKKVSKEKIPKDKEKKIKMNQEFIDRLEKIESSCEQQQSLLSTLVPLKFPIFEKIEVKTEKEKQPIVQPISDFEKCFLQFIKSYDKMDQFEKPHKIRKLMKNTSTRDIETVTDMLETFSQASSIRREINKDCIQNGNKKCSCNHCPHRDELQRIDDFYNRFLVTSDVG